MKKIISAAAILTLAAGLAAHPGTHVHASHVMQPIVHKNETISVEPASDSVEWDSEPVDWNQVEVNGTLDDLNTGNTDSENVLIEPYKVIGNDERRIVSDTTKFPYSPICQLLMAYEKNGQVHAYIGTGFMISPDTILTAAHNLYDHESGLGRVKSVRITPGMTASSKPFGEITESAKIYVPQTWYSGHNTDYDFGLIKLSEPLGDKTGYFKLITFDSPVQSGIELSGYPYTAGQDIDKMPQYTAKGDTTHVQGARTLFHTIDSGSGQSGSPLFNSNGEVGAIHTFASNNSASNGATMIDSYVMEFVNSVAALDKPVYRLYNPNTGEHFYTKNYNELAHLVSVGWKDEGMAWRDQADGQPVYRLYNPNAGDHHYTTDAHEKDVLISLGWKDEGVSWNAATSYADKTVYRLYNPNALAGAHHFTTNEKEKNYLASNGWHDEGIAFSAR